MNMEKLDTLRESIGVSVDALCKHIGKDRSTYYNWMKNPDSVKVSDANSMCKALRLTEDEMRQVLS